jgi:hypothetical protein
VGGQLVDADRSAVAEASRIAERDARRNPDRSLAAWKVVRSAVLIIEVPNQACLDVADAQVVHRFGPGVQSAPPDKFKPEWRDACHAEFRWQVARLLSYRSGFLDRSVAPIA